MLLKNHEEPLYLQVQNSIKSKIFDHVYVMGDKIPTELELIANYKVSRSTIRRAVEELVKEGYLVKRQAKGTFVCYSHTNHLMETVPKHGLTCSDILSKIGKLTMALDSLFNMEFKSINLRKEECISLILISGNPGVIQEKLSIMKIVDGKTATQAIKNLEIYGLISGRNDNKNNKIRLLFPTKDGLEIYSLILEEVNCWIQAALNRLSSVEVQTIFHLLQKI